jgi:peptide/nickel transport system ATP-binding protein
MHELVVATDLKVHFSARSGLFSSKVARAVDGVSLTIHESETLALVGESGCGKTTLGRALLRLIEPAGGDVLFDGDSVLGFDKRQLRQYRKQAQAIFQDPYSSMSPYMTISEIVSEPLKIHGIDGSIEDALQQVKLQPVSEIMLKFPHALSGGQRQRVSIARALTLRPRFIVADEPVSMVDASNRAEILSLLRDLQTDHGIAFLYITHDLASAKHFSDRIAVMYLGIIVETGSTHLIIDNPQHPYTKGLLAAVPDASPGNRSKLRETMPGELPSALDVPEGCPFHSRCISKIEGTCETQRPEPKTMPDGRTIACHLY